MENSFKYNRREETKVIEVFDEMKIFSDEFVGFIKDGNRSDTEMREAADALFRYIDSCKNTRYAFVYRLHTLFADS